jgi:pimeloyl-ACP methyl ester carboxylesterase
MRSCPSGDGGAVLVLPGILRGDRQTALFRDHLRMLGYTAHGWELGLNLGPRKVTLEALSRRVRDLAAAHGPVRIVGFSMGGLLARWIAQTRPAAVRQVISVVSPFGAPIDSAWLPLRPFLSAWSDVDIWGLAVVVGQTPRVPWAAIYSSRDGVVAWQACLDPAAPERCFEVPVRHRWAPREAAVFTQVAACLAAPDCVPPTR